MRIGGSALCLAALVALSFGCQKTPPAPTASPTECPDGCAAGEVCRVGKCFPAQCETERCGALEVCLNGACTPASCVGVICPGDQQCAAGTCYPKRCGAEFCKSTEVCRDSECVDARCVDVSCGANEICAGGRCYSPACGGTTCPSGSVCEAGNCVSLACAGVVCPDGLRCVSGICSSVCPAGQQWSGTECVAIPGGPVPQTLRAVPDTAAIPKGTSQQLKAELVWSDGSVTDVTQTATWKQGTCFLVTKGLVRAVGDEGCSEALVIQSDELDGSAMLTVGGPIETGLELVDSANFGGPFSWQVGGNHGLQARHVYSDGTVSPANEAGVTWTSSDSSVVSLSVDPGLAAWRVARALKLGTATVTVTWGTLSDSASITASSYAPLVLNQVSPTVGYPGQVITVYGNGFDPNAASNGVQIGAAQATVGSVQPAAMAVVLPDAGFGTLTVTTDGGQVSWPEPITVGLPGVTFLSPTNDSGGAPFNTTLVDHVFMNDNGGVAYWQTIRSEFYSPIAMTFDLGTAQQKVSHVTVHALDAPNGCNSAGYSVRLPPAQVSVELADTLGGLDAGTSSYTGYFTTESPPSCGRMRAFTVATPGGAGRYARVTITPTGVNSTAVDEVLFSPE